jgi:tol-pal system protein YbgF
MECSQLMARSRFHCLSLGFAGAALLLVFGAPAFAQSSNQKPAQPAQAAASGGDAALKARVEALEEQLVDMQVVVGTLESLARGGGAAPAAFPASSGSGNEAARIDGLETQVRALTAQLQQLSDQVRNLGGNMRRGDIPSDTDVANAASTAGSNSGSYGGSGAGAEPGFGSTTVSPNHDAIGGLLDPGAQPQANPQPALQESGAAGAQPAPVATAALPLPLDSSTPKQLYETAYGYLLQRDYGAAEAAFSDFLKKYPNDSLSGNAQYWLGETHFVRGQYKAAAEAFLKGYQSYGQSVKAPDSLLKLAMSLDKLGQKDAACSSYAELSSKFPNAPQSVKARAQSERQRVGCH